MPDEPTLRLEEGRRLLDSGDFDAAVRILAPLTGHPDPDLAGETWLAIGTARYRADDEPGALAAWQQAANTNGASAWLGWRSVAEQLVRDGDLESAIGAYREADRRAPPGERGAIANRIAWLLKETGHDFEARRQFNRARGAYATHVPVVTWTIIAICAAVFGVDALLSGGSLLSGGLMGSVGPVGESQLLNGILVANGEWWRMITSTFVHLGLIHLGFNMYVLYLYGPVVERMYGSLEYGLIYLLCGAGGSVLTILWDPTQFAAGASGAIFGIIGLLFAVSRRHHAVLGREARSMMAGIGSYLVFLLIFTFVMPRISWTGHLGGLIVGFVLGWLLPPTGVATLGSLWRSPTGDQLHRGMPVTLRLAVYAGVLVVLVIGSLVAVNLVG
ncbi:MAG TPA: rhomboid family intramembrane serine protease [Candidatus Limnocylindria bacterium]|jgi:membrane associated rhomboid family serine protease|nr:rhomboid family intramembrane serine protease [Candidatus Limnocylindria bacterium]